MPVLHKSAFKEKGVLTPEEFVLAGDTLVSTCPTWSWQGGEIAKRKPYLPPDKQYLVTRNVPSLQRASAIEMYGDAETIVEGADGDEESWVATQGATLATDGKGGAMEEDIPSMDDTPSVPKRSDEEANTGNANDDDDGIPDMADFETDDATMEVDEASLPTPYLVATEPEDHIVRTRTYDLSITYDKYYQTPRVWLYGYDEARTPLRPEQALEDVSHDHARKTVTVETHPHASIQAASIHPCQHASVMKKLSEMLTAGGSEPRVDQYLFLFLKFLGAIIPTIEYDFTMSVGR
eukprot:CAMPEP_0198232184 /NCGR_PEP_ID=MMETSP1445-20131203/115594_1 /TAXON_ID=36898 /ORGANISM="Pyramimonas sp., Strain CCMP2087" /LENGTH=292 /DNA_ID=CAMNT_0043912839 /DNA_START=191 /DNA_END=1069 /DNA_ORIENTATION=+